MVITTVSPNRELPLLLRLMTFTVKKGTTDFSNPVGTGPFKLESYSDGNARLIRNEQWHGGAPLLEAIEVTRFDSTTAMANAVIAGQIDLASNVGAVAGRTADGRGDLAVVRRSNDVVIPIVMRTSDGPSADPRGVAAGSGPGRHGQAGALRLRHRCQRCARHRSSHL